MLKVLVRLLPNVLKGALPQPSVLDFAALDYQRLPVLSAAALIAALGQSRRLRLIRRLAAADDRCFNALYQPALDAFVEAAQLRPASAADHHASAGGLIVHTLDVIERALRYRKKHLLPQNADTETVAAQDEVWTYAVFAGALLHDAGKLLTLTQLRLSDRRLWTAHGPSLLVAGATHYTIEFVSAPYALQTQVNGTLFHLLPATGRDWLAQHTEILAQLTAALAGESYDAGALGEMIRRADGESVADNRRTGGAHERLPNAPSVPMVERLMRALRQLLYDGALRLNRSGAAGWVLGQHTYLVCGTVAERVIEKLRAEGSTDIPSDNTRLFDIWQDHGFAIPTPAGQAVWRMRVEGEGYAHALTMLKFGTEQLFHPSRAPELFQGTLTLDEATAVPTEGTATGALPQSATADTPDAAPFSTTSESGETATAGRIAAASTSTPEGDTSDVATMPKTSVAPTDIDLDSPELGAHFLAWVRAGLRDQGLTVNRKGAQVHTLKEGVVLVSPAIFKAYLFHYGWSSPNDGELDVKFRRVQSRLQKLRLHRRTARKYNIFKIHINGPNNQSDMQGWLFAPSVLYGDQTPPPPNKLLELKTPVESAT